MNDVESITYKGFEVKTNTVHSVAEVAKGLEMTPVTVRRFIQKGIYKAVKRGKRLFITGTSIVKDFKSADKN